MINIITRTHNRPNEFKVLKDSIDRQTYKDINWIVGSDTECSYHDNVIKLSHSLKQPIFIPHGYYFAPYNQYLNDLALYVKEGYVMYIDDDDMFTYANSLNIIDGNADEDTMLIWKVKITPAFIVPSYSFGRTVTACDFSGIGFCFHSKHLPIDWGYLSMGDYRVGKQLELRGLKLKWLDAILTKTQKGAHNGK